MGGRPAPGAAGRGDAGSAAAAPHFDPAGPLCGAGGTARPQALSGRDTHTYIQKRDKPLEEEGVAKFEPRPTPNSEAMNSLLTTF